MKLNVNPNRMELLKLKRRLALAERGHKLLKDKLEEMLRKFLEAVRRLGRLQEEINAGFEKIFLAFAMTRGRSSAEELETLIPDGEISLAVEKSGILSLTVPEFKVRKLRAAAYDLVKTEGELDIGVKRAERLVPLLMEAAGLWKSIELLSREIESTRRRVNALEHILIPGIRDAIRFISLRLEEMERSHQLRLMRLKEIIRHHS